jgi:hypothetical protein
MLFLICSALVLGAVRFYAQCPDNGQTKVFNSKQGSGYYFYKFLGDSSFRYFLNGKTFSYNDKDDRGRTFAFIDDMAYELIIEDKADFAKYVKGSKPQDILLAQARYEQDHYKQMDPSMVITDYGPPSSSSDGGNDRPFYLWKKENPPGKKAATQYLVSTLIKDRVILLSIMLLKPTVTENDVFSQLETYTGHFNTITGEQCASALSMTVAP